MPRALAIGTDPTLPTFGDQHMLVLSRKRDQSIQIGDIVIVVNQIRGNKVTLGIEAPREVEIRRGELSSGSEVTWPERRADELKAS